jgi:hypothetical protein
LAAPLADQLVDLADRRRSTDRQLADFLGHQVSTTPVIRSIIWVMLAMEAMEALTAFRRSVIGRRIRISILAVASMQRKALARAP